MNYYSNFNSIPLIYRVLFIKILLLSILIIADYLADSERIKLMLIMTGPLSNDNLTWNMTYNTYDTIPNSWITILIENKWLEINGMIANHSNRVMNLCCWLSTMNSCFLFMIHGDKSQVRHLSTNCNWS